MALMVAALMWGLVLVLSLRARLRPDNTLLIAAAIIAASMTTNIPEIYLGAATWLPPNAMDLVANILLIAGVYYLSSAIRRGATAAGTDLVPGANRARTVAVGTILAMVVAFAFIDNSEPSTNFMLTYGDQPAAAAYSMVQYIFIFGVMMATLTTCVRNVPRMVQGRFRVGFSVTGAGCSVALLLCISVVAMDVCHVLGAHQLMVTLGGIYDVLFLGTITLLCVGLSIPPLARQISSFRMRKKVLAIEPEIRRIWSKTVAINPSISLVGSSAPRATAAQELGTTRATDGMHRMLVEIHDYIHVTSESDALTADDWHRLGAAETLCLHQGRLLDG